MIVRAQRALGKVRAFVHVSRARAARRPDAQRSEWLPDAPVGGRRRWLLVALLRAAAVLCCAAGSVSAGANDSFARRQKEQEREREKIALRCSAQTDRVQVLPEMRHERQ